MGFGLIRLEKERLEQSSAYMAPVKEIVETSKSMESPLSVDEVRLAKLVLKILRYYYNGSAGPGVKATTL